MLMLTRKLWMDRRTDGQQRTVSDHSSSLSTPFSGELKEEEKKKKKHSEDLIGLGRSKDSISMWEQHH